MEGIDLITGGQGGHIHTQGDVADVLLNCGFNLNVLRPYVAPNGRSYITQNVRGKDGIIKAVAVPLRNATATLRYDEWKAFDTAVMRVARERLKAVADLRAAGLTYTIPNALGHTVLVTQTQSDISDAIVSMNGLRESADDRPEFEPTNLPLPIIHKDFHFSAREIATSRNSGMPLDTSMAEDCGRKVAEIAEKLAIGSYGTYAFGGGTIYGMTNFPNRGTQLLTAPTDSGWGPSTIVNEVLTMIQTAIGMNHYGPFRLYYSTNWTQYLNRDYSSNYTGQTAIKRLREIDQIQEVSSLDYLTGYQMILVEMSSSVIRMVVGFDSTTVQWETQGGMKKHYKVMAMLVPQLRCDHNDNTGIVHGSSSSGDLE